MHKWAKEILECVKSKVEGIGLENFEGQNLDDLKDWTEIAKNIAKFDKDYKIVEAMEETEKDEILEMYGRYADDRRFYDNYRYANGRFAPKGHGTRRSYSEPYYHQMPEDYRDWENRPDKERMRDLDRMQGRMYYTEPMSRDTREGKSGISRRTYMETKEMHKANTPEDKNLKVKELENYLKELSEDVTEMLVDMTPEERTLTKTKLTTLISKM